MTKVLARAAPGGPWGSLAGASGEGRVEIVSSIFHGRPSWKVGYVLQIGLIRHEGPDCKIDRDIEGDCAAIDGRPLCYALHHSQGASHHHKSPRGFLPGPEVSRSTSFSRVPMIDMLADQGSEVPGSHQCTDHQSTPSRETCRESGTR